ncbi:MAG: sugar transferase, partial [Candidatus Cloacimonetes bacterium]|nr:sugar transferase [Candidatus Cloacimonadota bacterium]
WGKVFRSLWIDELPQLINFLKGELSLVGIRALSEHYFNLYPPDLQELRCQFKPGLIPPFYADMPKTFDEIISSERRYLEQKREKPFSTDWKYFWKAFWNIMFKHARSR